MKEDKMHLLGLIIGMWKNNIIEGNGGEYFEDWCNENLHNEEQRSLMNKVKDHVDTISYILGED